MLKKGMIIKVTVGVIAAVAIISIGIAKQSVEYITSKAEIGQIRGSVTESGKVQGEQEITFYSPVSAPISRIDIEAGDVITDGELLLEYELSELEHAFKQAQISKETIIANNDGQLRQSEDNQKRYAKAVYEDTAYAQLYAYQREQSQELSEQQYAQDYYTNCDQTGISKRMAQKNEEILDVTQEIASLDYKIEAAGESASDALLKKRKKKVKKLNELEDEMAQLKTESAAVSVTGYSPEAYALQDDASNVLEDISRNWEEAKTNKLNYEGSYLNESQNEALKKQEESAEEQAEFAEEELQKAQRGIRAPFNGVITECSVKSDSYVVEGTPLFTAASKDDLMVSVKISRYDIGRIKVGQSASIDAAGKKYEGEVSHINQLAVIDSGDKSKVEVEVHILNPDENLIIGIETDVTIFTEDSGETLLIPYKAYYVDDNGSYCYLLKNGIIEKCYFTAGVVNEEAVQVVDGIEAGAEVVVDSITDEAIGKRAHGNTH